MANSPTTTATLLVPLLAVIVALSVNSVRDRDPEHYRLFVGVLGSLAFVPIFASLIFSASGDLLTPAVSGIYAALSFFITLVLITGTTYTEVSRGLNSRDEERFKSRFLLTFVTGLVLITAVIILLLVIDI